MKDQLKLDKLLAQREAYEQLKVQALEAREQGHVVFRVPADDLRGLLNACGIEITPTKDRELRDPDTTHYVSTVPFLDFPFSPRSLQKTATTIASSIGYSVETARRREINAR